VRQGKRLVDRSLRHQISASRRDAPAWTGLSETGTCVSEKRHHVGETAKAIRTQTPHYNVEKTGESISSKQHAILFGWLPRARLVGRKVY